MLQWVAPSVCVVTSVSVVETGGACVVLVSPSICAVVAVPVAVFGSAWVVPATSEVSASGTVVVDEVSGLSEL